MDERENKKFILLDELAMLGNPKGACTGYALIMFLSFLDQVKLSEKLSHVQSLCIHEMIVRAFKHILQAVIANTVNINEMAVVIASALNLMLGVSDSEQSDECSGIDPLVWRWLEVFIKKRYEWDLSIKDFKNVRKFAILRGLSHKVVVVATFLIY